MLSSVVILVGLFTLARGQQIVYNQNGSIAWTCPDRSTIDAAYYDYCMCSLHPIYREFVATVETER